MIDDFDLGNPLVCKGIVGDGCGGGRIFFIKDETLYAHDPLSKESRILLQGIKKAQKISKSACVITIECEDENIKFNLSAMSAG
ncbi:thiamine biosynthesis protein ThiF [Sulfurimonas sp.]|uniref:thiamine biosynthesis protein ThiF n=1 Tax=Sulfurimonas sp. TaxID=2022749 RepID=UPI0025EF0AEA|nr:thiamine biosynthesis protein ThiF [Sulfurimonas sp.]MBW6488106.1 thiamine biosynthesis protein ThiF [Sulfurimonas sp.]